MKDAKTLLSRSILYLKRKREEKPYNKKETFQSYTMLAPQLIGFFIFGIYPIIWVLRWALYDYDGVTSKFVGLDNFIRIFTDDPKYWETMWNAFLFTGGKLIIEIPLALVIAVLLNSKLKGKNIFRAAFFMPNMVSIAIVGLIFYIIFDPYQGIVNEYLFKLNLVKEPISWFSYKFTAMLVLIIASTWASFGVNMLYFLTGLMNIPQELYECADIDGASKIQQFFHITVPMLGPVLQVVLMLAMLGSLKATDIVLVLTNGQPAGDTEVVMTYIFKHFFSYGEGSPIPAIGYASAMGFVTATILAVITVIYLKWSKKYTKVY